MSEATAALAVPRDDERKLKSLTTKQYLEVAVFVLNYSGLPVDCETELMQQFPHINKKSLQCILQNELTQTRLGNEDYKEATNTFLKRYESDGQWLQRCTIVNLAQKYQITPGGLCRSIIQRKYNFTSAVEASRFLKYPQLLEDERLEVSVRQALMSDIHDGPCIDLERRILGEEYEYKMQQYAKQYGLQYMDEKALRALGFDKTPDMKLEIPFLYKGTVITWIESKATFGDLKMHQNYNEQYTSYVNRFGAGIVIYWFGYQKNVLNRNASRTGVIVLDDFPSKSDLVLLNLDTKKPTKAK